MYKQLLDHLSQISFYFHYPKNADIDEIKIYFNIICKHYKVGLYFIYDKEVNKYGSFYDNYNLIIINLAKCSKYHDLFTTFFHELTHFLQYKIIKNPKSKGVLFFEQLAGRFSYHLCKQFFKNSNIHHNRFKSYQSKETIKQLLLKEDYNWWCYCEHCHYNMMLFFDMIGEDKKQVNHNKKFKG